MELETRQGPNPPDHLDSDDVRGDGAVWTTPQSGQKTGPHTAVTINDDEDTKTRTPEDGKADDAEDETDPNQHSSLCCLHRLSFLFRRWLAQNWNLVRALLAAIALLTYFAYFIYCMNYEFGNEPSIRLLVGTILGVLIVTNKVVKKLFKCRCTLSVSPLLNKQIREGLPLRTVARWSLYILSIGGAVTLIAVDVAVKRPENLICLGGLALLILFCYLISRQPDKINWHAVFWGIGMQFWFATLIRKTTFGSVAFKWLANRFVELIQYTDKGSETVFGATFREHNFVFQIMPTLIFFNAIISMFYYWGLVQIFIATFGKFLGFCLGTSPIECVNAAANLFLTLSEASVLIKPFMSDITESEMFAVMTGGFASIAGFLLYTFAAFGAPVDHILTASVMSAPAALAFAKLIYPDERKPTIKAEDAYNVDIGPAYTQTGLKAMFYITDQNRHYGSMLGALSKGAKEGLSMAGYVVINLIVYVAILEFLDQTVQWFAERAGVHDLNFSTLVSYVLYPLVFMMGYELKDCLTAARLLGIKIFTTTPVTYIELGKVITNGEVLQEYIATYNDTWSYVGDDVFLEATNTTLVGGVMTDRSGILATYMVCGLSSMGAIGVAIGTFTSLAPARSVQVYRMVPLALLAGNIASFSTACVAGLLYTD